MKNDDDILTSKYRPTSLDEIIGQPLIVKRLRRYAKAQRMPHCMFSGRPGIGKTSSAVALFYELYGDGWKGNHVLDLNASDERGIDTIRNKVQDFAKVMSYGDIPFKIVFLDEADSLTKDAQQTLRRIMEDYSSNNRFILSCNFSHKILSPIQDRCVPFKFGPLGKGEIYQGLTRIIEMDDIKITDEAKDKLAWGSKGSMRRAITLLDDLSIGMEEEITLTDVTDVVGTFSRRQIAELIEACKNQDVLKANKIYYDLKITDKMQVVEIIHEMIKYLDQSKKIPNTVKQKLYHLLAEVEWRSSQGSEPWVQFRWLMSQIKDVK